MKNWQELPKYMRSPEVKRYYEGLKKKRASLFMKRVFDLVMSVVLIILLSVPMLVIGILVKATSPGEMIFKQTRVTAYGRRFTIYKFRTMVAGAPQIGSAVTVSKDARVTGVGRVLRKFRLDEFPQLFNILRGDMSFVGTRPEVEKYVAAYTDEMYATLLLPAGLTSHASIEYKDEERFLSAGEDADETYIHVILPEKMKYNLEYLEEYSFGKDMAVLFRTVAAVLR